MNESFVFRCSSLDKEQLSLIANERGTNISALIRQTLIKERLLNPFQTEDDY